MNHYIYFLGVGSMFGGSMVAMVTPMLADGKVDYPSLSKLVEFHIENSTDAIVVVGTTGESATLDNIEHCDVICKVVDIVQRRIPVIAGTGSNSTREALELTSCAKDAGADACLLVTPYYNKPTQQGLYEHYRTLAENISIPQILYNVPGRTACDLLPATVKRLLEFSNIVGIKEATGSIERIKELVNSCEGRIDIYSGDDATALDSILSGGQGVISVTANVAPKAMHKMCSLAIAGDQEKARKIDKTLSLLHRDLFLEANPIPVKWACAQLGLASSGIRLPLTELATEFHEQVRVAMRFAGVCK